MGSQVGCHKINGTRVIGVMLVSQKLYINGNQGSCMKISVRLFAVLALSALFVAFALAGGPAPNFKLSTIDGKTIELKSLAGKAVVVNFWATWCGPCKHEIPGMMKIYEKYKQKGFEIVGISLDRGGWKDLKPFLTKNPISYPIVLGGDAEATAYGGIEGIPTSFFIDRKGNIVSKTVGSMEEDDFEKAVKNIL
jgi:peroxiredoxin